MLQWQSSAATYLQHRNRPQQPYLPTEQQWRLPPKTTRWGWWAPHVDHVNWINICDSPFSCFLIIIICPDAVMIYLFCCRERRHLQPSVPSDTEASLHVAFLQVSAGPLLSISVFFEGLHLHLNMHVPPVSMSQYCISTYDCDVFAYMPCI